MRYQPIDPQLFISNRKRFVQKMKPDSIAIFVSNDQMPKNGDQYFPFRQSSDLFGLTGLDQEETILVLFPNCVKEGHDEVAFIKKTSKHIAIWEGKKYSKEEATKVSGIKKIYWTDQFDKTIHELILLAKRIYLNLNEIKPSVSKVVTWEMRLARTMQEKFPLHKLIPSQPILKKMAMIKQPAEVELIQKACGITKDAFQRVCGFVKPGVKEYEIEAEIIHEFTRQGANGHAYSPIVASGKNACVLHYEDNNDTCKKGDIILMDFGAEYANYASDLTRCIPVSGKFTRRQKKVYNAVLKVLNLATEMLVPGVLLDAYNKEVGLLIQSELLDLKLITKTDIKNQDPDNPAYKKYFMHGTSHHMGLDVHDLSNKYYPFSDGMVMTCEPGIYIPEENLGIRLENDILITDNGPINLMANIPIIAEEIEDMMN